MNNNYQINSYLKNECDECLIKGICTVNSTLSSLQEIILLHIKEIAFYLLKLKGFGITNDSLKEPIIYALFNIVTNAEYNQEQFHELITKLNASITQSKILYEKYCLEHDLEIETLKTYFKHSKNFQLTDAIKKGEKYSLKKNSSFNQQQKVLFDIMLFLVKSVSIKIVESQRLEKDYEEAYYALLSMLDTMNFNNFTEKKAHEAIENFVLIYHKIIQDVFYAQIERYGEMSPVEVSLTTYPGKAVLVSGSDYRKLENVLKAVEKTDINVYTHGMEMLMAHSFPKLRSHKNLKGHYGSGIESSMIDFASFPGPVLMTKCSLHKIEYLYRGRLFTLDPIAPMGVVKLHKEDYEALIKSALDSKGFSKLTTKPSVKVGFSPADVKAKIKEIMNKIINKEIKHLYIIGLLNTTNPYKQYFDKFFEALPEDCYAISLCHNVTADNVYHLDSFSDYALIYKILKWINNEKPISEIDMSIFIPKCDKHIISNLLYLKLQGIKNIYMCKCPSSLVNPSLISMLEKTFDIKEFTDPRADIEATLSTKGD